MRVQKAKAYSIGVPIERGETREPRLPRETHLPPRPPSRTCCSAPPRAARLFPTVIRVRGVNATPSPKLNARGSTPDDACGAVRRSGCSTRAVQPGALAARLSLVGARRRAPRLRSGPHRPPLRRPPWLGLGRGLGLGSAPRSGRGAHLGRLGLVLGLV